MTPINRVVSEIVQEATRSELHPRRVTEDELLKNLNEKENYLS